MDSLVSFFGSATFFMLLPFLILANIYFLRLYRNIRKASQRRTELKDALFIETEFAQAYKNGDFLQCEVLVNTLADDPSNEKLVEKLRKKLSEKQNA